MEIAKTFGWKMKELRDIKRINQKDLSEMLGISQGFLSDVENGKKIPGGEIIINLKRLFPNLNLNWLLSDSGRETMFIDTTPAVFDPEGWTPDQLKTEGAEDRSGVEIYANVGDLQKKNEKEKEQNLHIIIHDLEVTKKALLEVIRTLKTTESKEEIHSHEN